MSAKSNPTVINKQSIQIMSVEGFNFSSTIFSLILQFSITLICACTISLNKDLGHPQPLLLRKNTLYGTAEFYLPTNWDRIELSNGDIVQVVCPGGHLLLKDRPILSKFERAICYNGRFVISRENVSFVDISCSVMPEHIARFTGKKCLGRFKEIEVGFVENGRFLKTMEICFDDTRDNTLYSKFNLTKTIRGFQFGFPRPGWIQGDFYRSTNVNLLYTRNTQRRTINNLLGLDPGSFKYVAEFGDLFLARGHLTARADFLYGSQQEATFYFVNAAPHWQTFNGANWMFLESDIRRFSAKTLQDLTIYTGTWGTSTLPHHTSGKEVELFLDVFGNHIRRIPVPQLFWKVLYEPISKAGIAFLGVNNPYIKDVEKYVICEDICGEIEWLTWDKENITAGYGYCCSVDDFRKTVVNLPQFEVMSLLK